MLTAVKLSEMARILARDSHSLPSGPRWESGPPSARPRDDVDVHEIAYSSKDVVPGTMFVCIKGQNDDGHNYAAEALRRGAVALLCEHDVDVNLPKLMVTDSRGAMNSLAAPFFGYPSSTLPIVGVTGTNGKTTTTFMIESVVRATGYAAGLIGTVETHVGDHVYAGIRTTPESIDLQRLFRKMIESNIHSCAMEVTSEGVEAGRIEGTQFVCAVFTNISRDHLDTHRTMERYFAAKQKLFQPHRSKVSLVNIDDPWGQRLVADLAQEVFTYGISSSSDLVALDIELGMGGSKFRALGRGNLEGIDIDIRTPIPGKFNVYNALAAVGACHLLGIDRDAIRAGIDSLRGVPGRFEPVDRGQPFSVIVDYAHTPDALANVLEAARGFGSARLIVVFGCGGDRDPLKRPMMGEVAAKFADVVVVTSDNPRSEKPEAIVRDVVSGLERGSEPVEHIVVVDRTKAIDAAIEMAKLGDVVLIAGKGHETYQEIAGRKVPYDDRVVAAAAIEKRLAEKRT